MELELKHLVTYARRWWWLLVLLPALAIVTTTVLVSRQQPLYSATATLLIQPGQSVGVSTDLSALQSGQRLATTYQQLVVTEPVLEPVAAKLDGPYTVGALKGMVSASTVRDTHLLRISVSSTDPVLAAQIADLVASEFQLFISRKELAGTTTSQAGVQALIDTINGQLADIQIEISGIESMASSASETDEELTQLRARRAQLENSLAGLVVQLQDLELQASSLQNQVVVYVPATVPGAPYAPATMLFTAVSGVVALIIAVATIGLLEYFDNTIKSSVNFTQIVGAPLLSVVPALRSLRSRTDQVYVLSHPTSSSSEAMRLLRTNIDFAAATREISSLTISSAVPGEGKSTISSNLAVAMTQAGFSVVLIDADLRRPSQHKIFNLENRTGLTTLLTHPLMEWQKASKEVVPGLSVIPSGPLPPNPADLLSTDRFRLLLESIQGQADIVLIDTPPVLAVSDPLSVSTLTDGVLLIGLSGRTRTDAFVRAAHSFPASVRLVGVVLNQQHEGDSDGYYYYGKYLNESEAERPARQTIVGWLRGGKG